MYSAKGSEERLGEESFLAGSITALELMLEMPSSNADRSS
jgi:hypothetical protein